MRKSFARAGKASFIVVIKQLIDCSVSCSITIQNLATKYNNITYQSLEFFTLIAITSTWDDFSFKKKLTLAY